MRLVRSAATECDLPVRGRDQVVGYALRAAADLRHIRPDIQRAFQFAGHQDARGTRVMRQPVRDLEGAGGVRVDARLLHRPCAG